MKGLKKWMGINLGIDIDKVKRIYKLLEEIYIDPETFKEYMKSIGKEGQEWALVYFKPKFLILPEYRYSTIPEDFKKIIRHCNKVRMSNLMKYYVYEVSDEEQNTIKDLWGYMWIENHGNIKKIGGYGLIVDFEDSSFLHVGIPIANKWNNDTKKLRSALRTLRKYKDTEYRKTIANNKKASEKIEFLENMMMALINFYYVIRSQGYEKDESTEILESINKFLI